MRISAVCLLGNTPPVATEFMEYLALSHTVVRYTLVSTIEPAVRESAAFAQYVLNRRFPSLPVDILETSISDIESDEDTILFMREMARVLRPENKDSAVHLCIAGGRKIMGVAATLLAQFLPIEGIFHIINKDVKNFNIELEKARKIISDITATSDEKKRDQIYTSNREMIENVMFPKRNRYDVLRIPLIPMPLDYVGEVIGVLRSDFIRESDCRLPPHDVERLIRCGLLERGGSDRLVPTKLGRELGELV